MQIAMANAAIANFNLYIMRFWFSSFYSKRNDGSGSACGAVGFCSWHIYYYFILDVNKYKFKKLFALLINGFIAGIIFIIAIPETCKCVS
jgi:hypothetical protein